jgi:hypothetical protein
LLGHRSAQPKPRQRTVPRYLDLAQRKWHLGFGECLDHCFLGREPGRQSMRPAGPPARIDFTGREDLAQVPVTERIQRVLDFLDGKDIASGSDPVPGYVTAQGDHAVAEMMAMSSEFTTAPFLAAVLLVT